MNSSGEFIITAKSTSSEFRSSSTLTQIKEGVLVKYQEDRELSGAHNILDECTS